MEQVFGGCTEHRYDVLLQEQAGGVPALPLARPPLRPPGSVRPMSAENSPETRTEHDSMGDIEVPADALWRAQTQRAVENFPISGTTLEPSHIVAIARVKKAAARINAELGILDQDKADAIAAGADEIIGGAHHDAFPIDVFQTGSGTSSNMNMNEVLASLAAQGRDRRPTPTTTSTPASRATTPSRPRIHVAAVEATTGDLIPALDELAQVARGARPRSSRTS